MIIFGSFLPSLLVGFATPKVYSGVGADIVMESITLKTPLAAAPSAP
jgi:cytochrome bd-type quinol oxidase subunit 2